MQQELDLPPTETDLPIGDCPVTSKTTCAYCNKTILQIDAVKTATDDYCSEPCANEDTLDKIRREGM